MDTIITQCCLIIIGETVCGPPRKLGRPRGGLRGSPRPELCGPVSEHAGTSGGLGERNGSFVGVRRHRREQGIVDLQGGCRAAATDHPAAARWARVTFPGPGFPRRTGPARVHLALRAAVLPPAAAPPARERRDPSCAARRDAQRQSWRLRSAHWSRRARERKAESRCRAFPLRLQSAEWRPAWVGSHAALGPSKVSGDVGPCVAGERGPGLATLTCGKATPACACWYARAE